MCLSASKIVSGLHGIFSTLLLSRLMILPNCRFTEMVNMLDILNAFSI